MLTCEREMKTDEEKRRIYIFKGYFTSLFISNVYTALNTYQEEERTKTTRNTANNSRDEREGNPPFISSPFFF